MGSATSQQTFAAAAALAALFAAPVAPAASPAARAPVVQSVLDCRGLADGQARLACFDKAVAGMAEAESTGDLVTIDKAQRRMVRRQAFGLNLPSFALFDRGEKPEEADRISVRVAEGRLDGLGKWIIKLDDGALWRQIDDADLYRDPRPGSTAVIKRAALGSFFMTIDNGGAIRVHRDQ